MTLELREDSSAAAVLVNTIEWLRKQVQDLALLLKEKEKMIDGIKTVAAAVTLDNKLINIEERLIQVRVPGSRQNNTRFPARLYDKISALAVDVETSDFKPTAQAREVHELLRRQLKACREELDKLINSDLTELNQTLKEDNIAKIIILENR